MTNPNKTHKKYQRIFSLLVSLFFVTNQVLPAYALPAEKQYIPSENSNTPTKTLDETTPSVDSYMVEQAATSQDFLQHELVLEKSTLDSEVNNEEDYQLEEQTVDYALANFSKDYAAAEIVKGGLTAEDIQNLVYHSEGIEIGGDIIDGKIVLYTTGNEAEIAMTPAAKALHEKSALSWHSHPDGSNTGVSDADLAEVEDGEVRYVVTAVGVHAYNKEGILETLSYQEFAELVNSLYKPETPTKETRDLLHQYIAEISAYNEDPTKAELLVAAGETIYPNQPRLGAFDSLTPAANFSASQLTDASEADKRIRIIRGTYNTTNGSFGGAIIGFGSTPANLSANSSFTFSFRTDNNTFFSQCGANNCIKVEFVDTSNRVASAFVGNLNSTFTQKTITKALLNTSNPSVDYANIKQINFVIDHTMVANKNNGFFEVKTGGLYFEPTFAAGSGPVTSLAGKNVVAAEVEPAGHNTSTFSQTSTSAFSFAYNLANGADADFSRWGGAVMSFGTAYSVTAADLVLGVKATGTGKVKFDIVSGTGANAKVTTVVAQGVTGTNQFYRISKALLDQAAIPGFDASNITAVYIVVDNNLAGSNTASGTVDITTANITSAFAIEPDATNPAITNAPLTSTGARPTQTAFVSYDPAQSDYSDASLTTFSQTFSQLNFNTYNTTSYAGVFFTYDNPATNDNNAATTADIETINLTTAFPNGIVFGLDNGGTGITEVNLEVTDITGKKDTVTLTGISAFGQRWKILTSKFDEVDLTKIQSIALVEAGRHVGGRLNIDWGTFAFVPAIPADGSNPAITPVPTVPGDLDKPVFTGFASFDPNNADPTKRDFSNTTVTSISPTFQQIDMNLYNTFSYGGGFVDFDNPTTNDNNAGTTTDIETINLTSSFPNGIVLGLDNGGTDITSAKLEVTDITGKKDTVILSGIAATGKRWKVLTSQFDEVDLTKIKTISVVVEGRHVGSRLNVDWGTFYSAQASDATNPAIQKLPVTSTGARPNATAFASQINPIDGSTDYSNATVTLSSQTFATLNSNTYNTNSFSGIFVSYDNAATNDNNAATTTDIETINLNTAFPNGLVFGLDNGGTDLSQVKLEVTDKTGKRDSVLLGGIQNFGKRWKVLASQFDDVDVTSIQNIALVIEGRHVGVTLNVDWGNYFFVPPIPADGSNPAITPVPTVPGDLDKPVFTGFASFDPNNADPALRDFSNTTVTSISPTFQQVDLNLYNTFSYGGGFVSFDNPTTNDNNAGTVTDIETIDLSLAFPSGIVLGLDNGGTDITQVKLEVTDRTGKKDSVYLSGIAATGKRWKVLNSQFDEVDTTKIQTISVVVEGRHVGSRLNVDWGNFFAPQAADGTNPAIQTLPVNSTGARPVLTGFASQTNPIDGSRDYSNTSVSVTSQTFATVDMNLYNTNSFGGAFVNYDNGSTNDNNPATTTDIETINLNTVFPNGIVFGLDNGGTALTQVSLEVTDITGKKDSVLLGGIQNFGKRWKVLASQFDDVDVTKIQSLALVANGRIVGAKLNVDWGNFFFVPPIPADPANPAITPVPTVPGDQDKPVFTAFASFDPNNADPALRDFSNASNTSVSPTFQQLDMNLYNTFSFGGGFVSFDSPATNDNNAGTTSDIENINLSTVFPNGIVLGLDNGGTDITQVKLEITDITGKKDSVILGGVAATGKRWKVLASQFDEIDITKVQTMALIVEGRHVGGRLNVDWGTFFSAQGSDATNPAIQTLPNTSLNERPAATAFASQVNPVDGSTDYSNATVTVTSQTFATVDMNLYNTNSFGGMFVSYDNIATTDSNPATTTDIETINLNTVFPNGLVFSLDNGGSDISQVSLEVTDSTGKKDSVLLGGIQNFGKRYKVLASQFDDADVTKIQSIALVVNGRHVGGKLNVDWGNFYFIPPIPADGTNPAITFAPLTSQGTRVVATQFSSNNPAASDFSNSAVTMQSATFAQVDVNLYNTNSYGGMFLNYDNLATTDNNAATTTDIETINLSTVFPNGIVLGLDNGGTGLTQVKLEVTDITGKKDSVYLSGIAATGKRWKVLTAQFDEVDITKIQTLALVIEGRQVGKRLNVDWGLFEYVPVVNADATNPAITKVPANSQGERPQLTAFASQTNPDGTTDFSNANVALTSPQQGTATLNLFNTTSFGGLTFGYDNPATNDNDPATTTDIETINMNTLYPNGLVFALSTNDATLTQVKLELTDVNGNRDIVILNGLTSSLKRFKISMGMFDQIDVTRIKQISIVVEGRHVNSQLSFDWGDFFYIPSV